VGTGPPEALGMGVGAGDLMAAPLPDFYLHPKMRGDSKTRDEEPAAPLPDAGLGKFLADLGILIAAGNVAGAVAVTVAVDGRIEVRIGSMRPTEGMGLLQVAIDLIKKRLIQG
jgi:hypothetical protein